MKSLEEFTKEILAEKYYLKIKLSLTAREELSGVEIVADKVFTNGKAIGLLEHCFKNDIEPRAKTLYAYYIAEYIGQYVEKTLSSCVLERTVNTGEVISPCEACGNEISPDHNYCPECGKKVTELQDVRRITTLKELCQYYEEVPEKLNLPRYILEYVNPWLRVKENSFANFLLNRFFNG